MQPTVQIVLTMAPDGNVGLQVQGPPNSVLLLGLLEQGKVMVMDRLRAAAAGPAIAVPGPGLVNRLNGKN